MKLGKVRRSRRPVYCTTATSPMIFVMLIHGSWTFTIKMRWRTIVAGSNIHLVPYARFCAVFALRIKWTCNGLVVFVRPNIVYPQLLFTLQITLVAGDILKVVWWINISPTWSLHCMKRKSKFIDCLKNGSKLEHCVEYIFLRYLQLRKTFFGVVGI